MSTRKKKQAPRIHFLHALRSVLAAMALGTLLMVFIALPEQETSSPYPYLQLVPALLAFQFVVVGLLLLATLLFGRVYCSILCPLGILQDAISRLRRCVNKKAERRFGYSSAKNWLRYPILLLFIVLLAAGFASLAGLLEPYSAFGRIAQNLIAPLWAWGNNGLAWLAEQAGSYRFSPVEIWVRSWPTFSIALATLGLIAVLAWRHGRTYCNTLCPVGTLLGLLSRWSLFGIRIDTSRCVSCGLCAKQCKASCINPKEHAVDASRCVTCMNCLDACHKGAISYGLRWGSKSKPTPSPAGCVPGQKEATQAADPGRRNFLLGSGIVLASAATRQQEKLVDGGLAVILDKEVPARHTPIVPPGAQSLRHLARHCTGCQLCVAACPNGVLRPSADLQRLMQPECSYERGYCRPECTKCSNVCPAGALKNLRMEDKSSVQIGHAVWVRANCVAITDGVRCGNCALHCPTGAISMVRLDPNDAQSPEIPVVNEERCIGCGACEHLCPARPHSAIYVEGHEEHRCI